MDSVANIGPHYARTLCEWRKRFEDKFESDIIPALQKTYRDVMDSPDEVDVRRERPGVTVKEQGEIEVFRRKWIYYL